MKNLKQWICAVLVLVVLGGVAVSRAATPVSSEDELKEAVAQGGEIIISEDIVLTDALVVSGEVTIKAQSPVTITVAAEKALTVTGTLTLGENISIEGTNTILYVDGGTVNIEGAALTADHWQNAVCLVENGGVLNIASGCVSSPRSVLTVSGSDSQINITGGVVASESKTTIYANDNSTVMITGGTISSENYRSLGAYNGSVATITGGDFTGSLLASDGASVTVSGGTFSHYLSEAYLAKGMGCAQINGNTRYTIGVLHSINHSLSFAVGVSAATTADDTVTVGASINKYKAIAGEEIIYTVTAPDDYVLTMKKDGKEVITYDNQFVFLMPDANVTLEAVLDFAPAVLAEGTCGVDVTWVLTDDGTLTISGEGAMSNYRSPEYTRNGIMPWYDSRDLIRKVVVKAGVTTIGEHAFFGAPSLQRVLIAEGVTSIGVKAFRECDALIELTIPESMESVGDGAFTDCGNLTTVTYGGSRVQWNMLTYGHNELIEATTTFEGNGSVGGSCGVDVTWVLTNEGVLTISGEGAMKNYDSPQYQRNNIMPWYPNRSEIRSLIVEEGVTTIGDHAFFGCANLQSVTIAEGVTRIGEKAFCKCDALVELTIPESMESVGASAFADCGNLTTVTYGGSRVQWNMLAYGHNALVAATTTCEGNGSVGGSCGVDVTWVLTNEGVLTISGEGAMSNYDSPKYQRNNIMPWYPTRGEIRQVVIEAGVTTIGEHAFFACANLRNVTIADGVTSIGASAFCDCGSLTEVTIPESVTSLGGSAFAGCGNLATVTYGGSRVQWNMLTYGHSELIKATTTCEGNGSVGGSCGVDVTWVLTNEGVLTISGEGAMSNYDSPKYQRNNIMPWYPTRGEICQVVIEEGVTTIGEHALFGCVNLLEVTIPLTLESVGKSAFCDCDALEKVNYDGSNKRWNTITIAEGNDSLIKARGQGNLIGDVNSDGEVNTRDVIFLLQMIASKDLQTFTEKQAEAADANCDEKIATRDAIEILQAIASKATNQL